MKFKISFIAAAFTFGTGAFAQTKWDLPAAYPATNFHTKTLSSFMLMWTRPLQAN